MSRRFFYIQGSALCDIAAAAATAPDAARKYRVKAPAAVFWSAGI